MNDQNVSYQNVLAPRLREREGEGERESASCHVRILSICRHPSPFLPFLSLSSLSFRIYIHVYSKFEAGKMGKTPVPHPHRQMPNRCGHHHLLSARMSFQLELLLLRLLLHPVLIHSHFHAPLYNILCCSVRTFKFDLAKNLLRRPQVPAISRPRPHAADVVAAAGTFIAERICM